MKKLITAIVFFSLILVSHWGGNKERIRLIGIDTPESVHPDKERNGYVPAQCKVRGDFTALQKQARENKKGLWAGDALADDAL